MQLQESLRLFSACQSDLGESPVWDETSNTLLFVDISRGQINALDQQGKLTRLHQSPARVGALALTCAGNLMFTRDAGIAILDRTSLEVSSHAQPVSTLPSFRFNDAACDPQGRFVTGLMDEKHSKNSGKFYRYDSALNGSVVQENVGLPNGMVWSIDGREMFFVDSLARTLYRARYPASGHGLEEVSVFARTPPELGRPDGLAMDIEGGIWVCQFNGGCLLRYDRHGKLHRMIEMPVPRPTSCCFGGADMRTLFITTARFGMPAAELADFPDAGNIYSIRLPVAGVCRYRFKEVPGV